MSNILIAEDEPRLAAFVEKGLRKNGFRTAIANDGEQTLKMAKSGEFDLLLLDLGLPLKDGLSILAELQTERPAIPIIIVTAREDARGEIADFHKIVKGFVNKPFRFGDLLGRIRTALPSTAA